MHSDLWCHLEYEGHKIAVQFSIWSGIETVYVDDHPVSQTRNLLRFKGDHPIVMDDKQFTIQIEVENPFTYKSEIRLKKGARTLLRKNVQLVGTKTNKQGFQFLLGFIAGFIIIGGLTGLLLLNVALR